jgi:iodotyrosine deiodinase
MEDQEVCLSGFVPYRPGRMALEESLARAEALFEELDGRRSVRAFSPDPVPRALIERAIATASTAPSGAHRQPWRFVAVSDPAVKRQIREAAEAEERRNYEQRFPEPWLEALAPLGTTWEKPYLEVAPWLVVAFAENYRVTDEGEREKNYYVRESVGIACGVFIAALHHMGLATLTHTPSPMHFLGKILQRPAKEQAYILFPVGYPAEEAEVPALTRKPLEEVAVWFTGERGG